MIRIGTAGWTIPPRYQPDFATEGSHLQRYARRFSAAEINSSFHRPHRPATYARWAASVPADFRFAVKMPRQITHDNRLIAADAPLARFLAEISALGEALGPVLVQLPPSLRFDGNAVTFFAALRQSFQGALVCEPRHASWFTAAVDELLADLQVARVAADPPPASGAARPGGWPGLIYRRLHGAPHVYYSAYGSETIAAMAAAMGAEAAESWCIFDNTARGEALNDAARLQRALL